MLLALCAGGGELGGPLIDADDAKVMLRAIRTLGARAELYARDGVDIVRVIGVGGQWEILQGRTMTLDLHNAGTATRFLTAAAMLAPEGTSIVIDGDMRMRERPIGELVDALRAMGVRAEYVQNEGYPPVRVHGGDPSRIAERVTFGRTSSSQFISAVLLVAPFLPKGLSVTMPGGGDATSRSYIDMTLGVLRQAGLGDDAIDVRNNAAGSGTMTVTIRPRMLSGFGMDIEPDASGATYFEAAALLAPFGGRCTVDGLDLHPSRPSLQGDTQFVSVITAAGGKVERLNRGLRVIGNAHGKITPFDIDLADMPDTAMTAAVLAACASPPSPTADNPTATSVLHGLRTLRVKETDRLAALKTELEKVGAKVEIFKETWRGVADEGLRISASADLAGLASPDAQSSNFARVEFDTYKDHRMAMALALIGLRRPNVWIRDPKCVAKTYPTFFAELARLYERTV